MNKASEMQAVVEMTRSIPCAPAILPKLLQLTEGSAADIGELETLITMDTGLATSVLRTANTLTGRWLVHPLRGYGWEPGDLCRHSLCVAICAEVFAGMTNLADTSTAYTAGLIHDLGKFALAYANLSALDDVASRVPNEYATWREAETAILGYDSSQVTKALLENWGFPSAFISVGFYYQSPSLAPDVDKPLVTLIHAAKHAASQLGYGVGADGYYYEPDEKCLTEAGFTEDQMEAALPEILSSMQRFVAPDGVIHFN